MYVDPESLKIIWTGFYVGDQNEVLQSIMHKRKTTLLET